MSFSYTPLWRMLSDLGISKMDFAKQINISNTTLAKIGKNEPITLSTLDKICNEYGCKLEDIVTHIPDTKYTTLDSLPETGTVVIMNHNISSSEHTRYFVILNVAKSEKEQIPSAFYVAPIISTNREQSFFNIKFRNILINHEELDGYIAVGKSQWVDSDTVSGNFGIIPNEVLDKISPIINAAIDANLK